MKNNFRYIRSAGLLCLALSSLGTRIQAALVTLDTVLVGDAGNADASAANTSHGITGGYGYGGVNYDYRIGTTEVTINQYATFLNAMATSYNSPFSITSLHNTPMQNDVNILGITRTFGPTGYVYTVVGDGQRPVGGVNWMGAARFTNWVHNGATVGASTETGAYNLNGATSGTFATQEGATVWLPTEDEWYKAAFYDPTLNGGAGGYHLYTNQSNSMTSHELNVPGAANYAYFNPSKPAAGIPLYPITGNVLTPVGAYDTPSYYGTYDQGGNVTEYLGETSGANIVVRGGNARGQIVAMDAAFRYEIGSSFYGSFSGFRIAAAVPEPSAAGLLAAGSVVLVAFSRQRRRR